MRVISALFVAACVLLGPTSHSRAASSPNSSQAIYASEASATFTKLPFLPKCMKVAVVQGDPRHGPAIYLAKIDSGCVIPWHWHTANTRLIFVSGHALHWMNRTGPA